MAATRSPRTAQPALENTEPRARSSLRAAATIVDVGLVTVPLLGAWYFLRAIADGSGSVGGGQADRAVFGTLGVATAVALYVWNTGFREGRAGASIGKQWAGLITRDLATGSPIGPRRALRPTRRAAEVVVAKLAREEGFVPLPPDTSRAAVRRRRLLGAAALAVLAVIAVLASLAVGAQAMSLADVLHALVHPTGTATDEVVRSLRVPRTVLGLVVGIALGVAGALIQGHTRNPIADTGLLGLNAGAAFAVVLAIGFLGMSAPNQYVWFALVGTLVAAVVVFGTASIGAGRAAPLSLALAGAAVTFFLQAMTNAVVLLDTVALDGYRFWIVGSLAGRDLSVVAQVLPFLVLGLVLAIAAAPGLNVLSLGEEVARSLGANMTRSRILGITAITLLAGAATAACGPIAFVGLVVPHVARAITGPDYRWLVAYAGLLGGVALLFADVVGRVVVRPGELQVGIVLAIVGAPFFIVVVRSRKLVRL